MQNYAFRRKDLLIEVKRWSSKHLKLFMMSHLLPLLNEKIYGGAEHGAFNSRPNLYISNKRKIQNATIFHCQNCTLTFN